MDYDLLIKNGRVVDGSGLPSYVADVGIKDGKIAEMGRLHGTAARTIDANGFIVSPGFIDHHTHMDGQILWDPFGTCEPQHGVTSIIMGNCGLALAPVNNGDEDAIVKSFVRVEAIPRVALEKGVPWGWKSYGDYLNKLEGHVGINVGGIVGHIAVRQFVMGEESTERKATSAEVVKMRQAVGDAMGAGAFGLSTNRNERHMREDGLPVPSRLADDDELFALCEVVSASNSGVIQMNMGRHCVEQIPQYDELARRVGRPIVWQSVQYKESEPELWQNMLTGIAKTFADGYQAYGLTHTVPLMRHFSMKDAQIFDEFPVWKNLMFLPEAARKQAFADPATRQKMRDDMAEPRPVSFHKNWGRVFVEKTVKAANHELDGKSVAEVAALRKQDALDAFLDLSLEEDLETTFETTNRGFNPEAMSTIMKSPYVVIGTSDAGAHVQFGADFGYCTTLLGMWVRDRQMIALEQAIHKLTFHVASIWGIEGRGLLRPGFAADVTVFDPKTIKACAPEWAEDYPAATKRLIQRAEGVHYTIVNGKVIYDEGKLSGELAGTVLRSAAHQG
ncbi:MAG TPA: amidohydrolase family protein [Candidatus Binatia bacterium]|nr:amidohydrolase family protein [Candidatus Binatia bacterium]